MSFRGRGCICPGMPRADPADGHKEAGMNTTRLGSWASMACLALAATVAPAQAEIGLRVGSAAEQEPAAWPRWQARLGVTAAEPALGGSTRWQLSAGQVFGDYYWSGLRPARFGRASGFRATTGLLLGPRSLVVGIPALTSTEGIGLTWSQGPRLATGAAGASAEPWLVTPYVGLGYSAVSLRGGWGFTADLGLAGTTGGLRSRRDSSLGPAQGMDDLLRELRLTPMLQFGASYTF